MFFSGQNRKMSKRKQVNISEYFENKRKPETAAIDDEDNESISSSSSSVYKPSKLNHNVQFTLKMEQIAYTNGEKNLSLDFVFHLLGISDNRSNIGHSGDRELCDTLDSTLKINIAGTVNDNVEISVRFGSK